MSAIFLHGPSTLPEEGRVKNNDKRGLDRPAIQGIWSWETQASKNTRRHSTTRVFLSTIPAWLIALLLFYLGHTVLSLAVASISSLIFLSFWFWPGAYVTITAVFDKFAAWVGTGFTWILLTPFFYLFFPLTRGIRRISGKPDKLCRRLHPDGGTYWSDRSEIKDIRSYLKRQF